MLHQKTFTKKALEFFLVPISRFQNFGHLLQNAKPQEMTKESSSPIPLKKS